jgi:hypothetical protein
MRKLLLLSLLLPATLFGAISSRLNIEEVDGSPSTFPYKLKVTNGQLTDNGDGTATLSITGSSGGSGDNLGSHIATMTITGNFGIAGTTLAITNSSNSYYAELITSTGTKNALRIVENGLPDNGIQSQDGGALNIQMSTGTAAEPIIIFSSSTSNQLGSSRLLIIQRAPSYNDPGIRYIDYSDGSGGQIRIDGLGANGPNLEIVGSSDTSHGLSKWEPFAEAGNGGVNLQVNSRCWDNGSFDNLAYWVPMSKGGGLTLRAFDTTGCNAASGFSASSTTFPLTWETLNAHEVSLTGPDNPAASYSFKLPRTSSNGGQVLYQATSSSPRNWEFTTGGTAGNTLSFTSTSGAPTWGPLNLAGGSNYVTGALAAANEPAHTGDVTNSAGSLAMTAAALQNNITTFGSSITVTNALGARTTYGASLGSVTLRNVASGTQCLQADGSGNVTGTGSACGAGSSGGTSTLAVGTGAASGFTGTIISSPTAIVLFDSSTFNVSLQGSATSFVQLKGFSVSSYTVAGNYLYSVPTGCIALDFWVCGAGGSGGGGNGQAAGSARGGGTGGGGGACTFLTLQCNLIGSSLGLKVGTGSSGGGGGTVNSGSNGTPGTTTSIYTVAGTTYTIMYGGGAGFGNDNGDRSGGTGGGWCGVGTIGGSGATAGGCPTTATNANGFGGGGAGTTTTAVGKYADFGGGGGGAGRATATGFAGGSSARGGAGGGGSGGCTTLNACAAGGDGGAAGAVNATSGGGGTAGTSGGTATAGNPGTVGTFGVGGFGGGAGGSDQDTNGMNGGDGGYCGGGGGGGGAGTSTGGTGGKGGDGCIIIVPH